MLCLTFTHSHHPDNRQGKSDAVLERRQLLITMIVSKRALAHGRKPPEDKCDEVKISNKKQQIEEKKNDEIGRRTRRKTTEISSHKLSERLAEEQRIYSREESANRDGKCRLTITNSSSSVTDSVLNDVHFASCEWKDTRRESKSIYLSTCLKKEINLRIGSF